MAISAVMAAVSTGVTALAGGTFLGIASLGLTGAFGHFLISTAMGAALNALSPKPNFSSLNSASRGYSIAGESGAALDHQIIYGEARVGGVRVYDASTGQDNNNLHRIIAFAGHEIDSYQAIYLNDEIVTLDGSGNVTSPSRYNGFVRIKSYFGTDTQTADIDLVTETNGLTDGRWTPDHKLQGIAYLYARFTYSADAFPNGLPSISATIRGKKVFDPRSSTTAWSNNPALCVRDYLTSPYGLGQPSTRVAENLIITAANICDETVDSEKRYTCNGSFLTNFAPSQVISDLLTSMGGLLWYSQGKWRIKSAKYATPTVTLDENDLRSGISLSTRHSRRSNFNSVKGKFKGPESNWQEADYPEVTDPSYLSADNGVVNILDMPLPFTSSSKTAQRVANVALRRNREQLTFSASFGLKAFQVEVGDFVYINNTRFGWFNKPFEITNWSFGLTDGLDLQVQMTLREISEGVFTAVPPAAFEQNNTNLPNPFVVGNIGLSLTQELRVINEQVLGVFTIEANYTNPFIESVEIEYKLSTDTQFTKAGRFSEGKVEVLGVLEAFYDVRARAVNQLGVKGDWVTVSNWFVSPFIDPPGDVQNFAANVVGNNLHLTWEPVSDLDLSYYRIRYSSATSGATYSNGVDVVSRVARPANSVVVPARSGTYFIRAYDKLGNGSENPTAVVVLTNTSDIDNLNVVETLVEHPSFSGIKTSVVKTDVGGVPAIILDSASLFDSLSGDFDTPVGVFDYGDGVIGSGTYEFSDYVDLGAKFVSRVSMDLSVLRVDYVNTFDAASANFDSREGFFDGDTGAFDTTSVRTQVSFTDDDPSGTPVWSEWQDFFVGDIAARAIRFRVILSTTDTSATPAITHLTASIDMPDRIESGSDISFVGSVNVTYPSSFRTVPAIGISLANLISGQRYAITSKTSQGFTLSVFDSGGSGSGGGSGGSLATNTVTLDYVAKGYGKGL
jgi:hypothetical protein